MGVFPSADKPINIAASSPKLWAVFCKAAGREDWLEKPEWKTAEGRTADRAALNAAISEVTRQKPSEYWIALLEEAGIRPDLVVGTSAGSLVAALYAAGRSGTELGALAQSMDEGAITDWAFPGRGLIRGEALARYVREQTGQRSIEQMKLPLGIVATDLDSGAAILFQRGDTGAAVRASSAVPAVFQPVKIGSREYVDGGLVSPVPVRFARQMGAELVLAVDISTPPDRDFQR
jgi:predicted acylesterase/phospholipase RssA